MRGIYLMAFVILAPLLGVQAAGAPALGAQGAASEATQFFDNRLRIETALGFIDVYINPDGRYETHGSKGRATAGVWEIRDNQLCLRATDPKPPPQFDKFNCEDVLRLKIGETAEVNDAQRGLIRRTLLKGR